MTDSVVVEGYCRLRDGKKWKTRWLVLRKPSPVADCLVLLVFKDKSDKVQGNKERASVTLEEICGLEAGQWYEGVAFTLTVLCLNQAALLGFDSREALQAWAIRLRYSLGEVHSFSVGVLPGTKLESGPATLHLCNNLLALSRDIPPAIIAHWNLPDLRRYGPVPNGFVFEGGTRCGYWAGVFLLASAESEQISFLFDCVVRGISPSRGPFGLRPVLPELSSSQASSEEKLNHEAEELEKRLSMLSHGSSTGASSTYCPSVGGDDRSISGSSDASDTKPLRQQPRQPDWSSGPNPRPSRPQTSARLKRRRRSCEKLPANQGVVSRPASKTPRQLQEIGRQSSSDSGIATGSHSSYSGSFSSYTGSLDITSGEDFGSVFSLPPHLAQELSPCTCTADRGREYQVQLQHRHRRTLFMTPPRSLLQEISGDANNNEPSSSAKDTLAPSDLPTETERGSKISADGLSDASERQSISEHSQGLPDEGRKPKRRPLVTLVTLAALSRLLPKPRGYCMDYLAVRWQQLVRAGFSGVSSAPWLAVKANGVITCGLKAMALCVRWQNNRRTHGPSVEQISIAAASLLRRCCGTEQRIPVNPLEYTSFHFRNGCFRSNTNFISLSPTGDTLYHSSSLVTPVKKTLQKSSPGSGSIRSTEPPGVKTGEESAPFKRGEKLAGLLSDLLSFPSADRRPEAKAHRLNLYESMSPALGHGPSSTPAVPPQDHQDKRPVIYENCTKCRRAHCHPPPRAMPAKRYGSGDISTFQAFPNGPHLTESQERDCAADEEPLHQSLRNIDGRSQHEEMNGWTVNCEDEKRHSKGERCRADPAYATMESCLTERNVEIAGSGAGCLCTFKAEEKSKYELMGSYGQRRFLHEAEGPVFACPPEAPLSDRSRNEGATYVNIPVSPTSKKQVNYMELELQEPGPGARGTGAHLPAQRKSSTRYAHIDITATETAHKVGTQHALGRQEGLQTLELRRKGTPR
ncbi:uncharacterized protein LOC133420508 [Cololabis saira]|uniref:uncharacterized protein LOC133420508 n=1 Tax=Cololabis saira TaxID=129043 RepID=UPI002AD489DF|nr:uncharacterized protein LOC133420508 [Cololabis saira]